MYCRAAVRLFWPQIDQEKKGPRLSRGPFFSWFIFTGPNCWPGKNNKPQKPFDDAKGVLFAFIFWT